MKNFLSKLKTNKISLSFAIASCIAITFVCVISMTLYYTNSKTLINNFLNEKIKSVQSSLIEDINEFERSLVNTSFQILSDDVIYSVLLEKNVTVKEQRNATRTLKNQLFSEPVMECYILREYTGTLFNNSLFKIPQDNFEKLYATLTEVISGYKNGLKIFTPQNNASTFLITNYDFRGFYIIYVIDKKDFFTSILSSSLDTYDSSVYYNDNLLYSSTGAPLTDTDKTETVSRQIRIISTPASSSLNSFYKPFFHSLLIFLCTLIILAFAALFASTVFVNKRTEQYMQNLIYKSNQHHYTAIKSTIQRALSNRYISDQNQEFVVNYFKKIDYKEIYCMYIQLDSVEHILLTSSYEQIAKHMQNIKFIVENKLSPFGTCVVLDFNFDSIGIILGAKDIIQDNDILSKLDNARDIIKERFNLTVTVTITEPITTATDIFYTLLQLDNLKNYRFITGYNATINDTSESAAVPDVSYPSDIEKRISTSLIKGEKEEFENYMHEFCTYASKTTYQNAKEMVSKLVFTLSKHSAYSNQSTLLSDALKYDVLENSINFIKDHFTVAISAPHDTSHVSNNTFTQDVNEIFEREYKNPDFNLAYLANELDISVVYAGQKFKKLFEKSFNTYLSEYRVTVAMRLLANKDLKIDEIGKMCGFSSSSYFIKNFKNFTEHSPAEYRKKFFEQ